MNRLYRWILGAGLSGLSMATVARAAVTEPDGVSVVPINQSLSNDYFDNRFTENTLGLQSLFDAHEGAGVIDHELAATQEPATLVPGCSVEVALLLRGGSCELDFGWYCVDDPQSIYALITAQEVVDYHDRVLDTLDEDPAVGAPPPPLNSWMEYKNDDKGFVPTVQMPPLVADRADVRNHPGFALDVCPSQRIGFAIVGDPTSFCLETKYTEQSNNQVCTLDECAGKSWINAVIYTSQAENDTLYIAFEDLPTAPTTFSPRLTSLGTTYPDMQQPVGGDVSNDADFNDQVFRVRNLPCSGQGGAGGSSAGPGGGGGTDLTGEGGTRSTDSTLEAGAGTSERAGPDGGTDGNGSALSAGSSATGRVCEPGRQQSCACTDGAEGAQRCSEDGTGWEACVCTGDDGGCGCRVGAARSSRWAVHLALLGLLGRRRRRRSRGAERASMTASQ